MTNGLVPTNGRVVTPKPADPRRDYVAAGGVAWYQKAVRALPWHVDDITRDFGDDIYEQMCHDPTVAASLNALRAGILEDGVEIVSAVSDEEKDGYAQAQEIAAFCASVLDDLETPIDDVLWDMLSAIALGNRVAEVVYGLVAGKLVVTSVKVKPRTSTAFVVDPFMNVIGLLGLIPGQSWSVQVGTYLTDLANTPNLLPRDKFAILTYRPVNNDPRGTSALRPAYNGWKLKQIAWPEYLKYLVQFASPGLIGYTAENAIPAEDGTTPEVALVNALVTWKNATALALKFGSKVDVVASTGDGMAFLNAFQHFDRQIIHGILNQTLATMEGEHQSRAASETHQDVMDTLIRQGKKSVQRMVQRDILRPLVRYNFGDKTAALVPQVTLGETESQDLASLWAAAAQLARAAYFDASQYAEVDKLLSLPVRKVVDAAPATDTTAQPTVQGQQDMAPQNGGQAA